MKDSIIIKYKKPVIFWFSLICGFLLIFLNIFRWSLVDILTPFLEPFLELLIYILFFIASIWSFIYLFIRVKKEKYKSTLPFAVCLVSFLIIYFVPFDSIMLDIDFFSHNAQRGEVVKMIQDGRIEVNYTNDETIIKLPEKYKQLSRGGGEVLVERKDGVTKVLFFTFRGVLDNFAGFIYKSDNTEPLKSDFYGDFKEFKKYKDHWFWGTSY